MILLNPAAGSYSRSQSGWSLRYPDHLCGVHGDVDAHHRRRRRHGHARFVSQQEIGIDVGSQLLQRPLITAVASPTSQRIDLRIRRRRDLGGQVDLLHQAPGRAHQVGGIADADLPVANLRVEPFVDLASLTV